MVMCALLRRDGAAACANWLDRWGRPPLAWVALRDDEEEAIAVADALLRGGADPSPPVLRPGVLRRKTNLTPESPLAIADRRGESHALPYDAVPVLENQRRGSPHTHIIYVHFARLTTNPFESASVQACEPPVEAPV